MDPNAHNNSSMIETMSDTSDTEEGRNAENRRVVEEEAQHTMQRYVDAFHSHNTRKQYNQTDRGMQKHISKEDPDGHWFEEGKLIRPMSFSLVTTVLGTLLSSTAKSQVW